MIILKVKRQRKYPGNLQNSWEGEKILENREKMQELRDKNQET